MNRVEGANRAEGAGACGLWLIAGELLRAKSKEPAHVICVDPLEVWPLELAGNRVLGCVARVDYHRPHAPAPLRSPVAAFGQPGGEVRLASPATGEAIYAAIQARL